MIESSNMAIQCIDEINKQQVSTMIISFGEMEMPDQLRLSKLKESFSTHVSLQSYWNGKVQQIHNHLQKWNVE